MKGAKGAKGQRVQRQQSGQREPRGKGGEGCTSGPMEMVGTLKAILKLPLSPLPLAPLTEPPGETFTT